MSFTRTHDRPYAACAKSSCEDCSSKACNARTVSTTHTKNASRKYPRIAQEKILKTLLVITILFKDLNFSVDRLVGSLHLLCTRIHAMVQSKFIHIDAHFTRNNNNCIVTGTEYPDSDVGSEPEGRCDGRNEEGDPDSDAESPPRPSQISYATAENKLNGDYTVRCVTVVASIVSEIS